MDKMNYKDKAKELFDQSKLEERLPLLYGDLLWDTHGIKRIGLPSLRMNDGPLGIRYPTNNKASGDIVGDSKPSVCFPSPSTLACSFDREVFSLLGKAFALEAKHFGVNLILAPGVNIKRNPLGGRSFEYLSEDPLLAGSLAAYLISSTQSYGIGCCIKHFACNSQESFRFNYDSIVDPRALHELYLKPFEIAIKEADPWAVMSCYNRVNGAYGSDNEYLIDEVLRGQWNYDGVVMSDWGGTAHPIISHNHGLDLEMPCTANRVKTMKNAIEEGRLDLDRVNESSRRVMEMNLKPYDEYQALPPYDVDEQQRIALELAERSIVLAKNDGLLPLDNYEGVCLIGGLGDRFRFQGKGSSKINTKHSISLLEAIREVSPTCAYAQGYGMEAKDDLAPLTKEAVEVAKASDKVIYVIGLREKEESEGYDKEHIKLSQDQIDLFEKIYEVNKNIILVVLSGCPVEIPFASRCNAIILPYLSGEKGGLALSNILLGKTNPSGHLAESWPISYEDVNNKWAYPQGRYEALYKESIFVGYRYYCSAKKEILFPFGHGLSYSEFSYKDLSIDIKNNGINIKFILKNESKTPGFEVIQVYSSPFDNKVYKPAKELRHFSKVYLEGGEEKIIEARIPLDDLKHYDVKEKKYLLEGGKYLIAVGRSCIDTVLEKEIVVESFDSVESQRDTMGFYFDLDKKDLNELSDEEFEIVYGGSWAKDDRSPRQRPFNMNDTFRDISNTWIGKILSKEFKKRSFDKDSGTINQKLYDSLLDTPLRVGSNATPKIKERYILGAMEFANRRPFKALWTLLFGKIK